MADFDSDTEVRVQSQHHQQQEQQIDGFDMGLQEDEEQHNDQELSNVNPSGALPADEEEESVYIKDNIVMRRIQIEGEEQEYLMDPEGNIYDMQGNFIGTANANELEEMEEGVEGGDEGLGNDEGHMIL